MGRKTWPKGYRKRWQAELNRQAEDIHWLGRELRWQWRHRDQIEEPSPQATMTGSA